MPIELIQPDKLCNKCGRVIPLNGYEMDGKGHAKTDEHGKLIYHERALLICEHCARAAAPPPYPQIAPQAWRSRRFTASPLRQAGSEVFAMTGRAA